MFSRGIQNRRWPSLAIALNNSNSRYYHNRSTVLSIVHMSVLVLGALLALPYWIIGALFLCAKKIISKKKYYTTLLSFGLKTVTKCLCFLPVKKADTLNSSLVWKTLGLDHSFREKQHSVRPKLLRKWIIVYLNSHALGMDRKIWQWLTKAMKNIRYI